MSSNIKHKFLYKLKVLHVGVIFLLKSKKYVVIQSGSNVFYWREIRML